tara:strand:- start:2938 stop:3399 length:462 start_codon:yes stop_codon:yes gene_type:complete
MEKNDLLTDILKAYLAQTESALQISKILSEHNGDEDITPDSFIIGLIYRLMVPMSDDEMKNSLEFAETVFDASSDSEDYDIIEETYEKDKNIQNEGDILIYPKKIKVNTCNCDICSKARACLINYPNYEIYDELAKKFKDAIDNSLIIHKIKL